MNKDLWIMLFIVLTAQLFAIVVVAAFLDIFAGG